MKPLILAMAATAFAAGPPSTRTDDVKDNLHRTTLVDPYRWLENQTSPETRAGHAASESRSKAIDHPVDCLSFLFSQLGVTPH